MKKDWDIKKLGEICTIKGRIGYRGYTKQDLVNEGEGAITLSPSNIQENKLKFDNCTYISWEKYEESPEIKVSLGDIIYCKTASIGKIALVDSLPEKATINPQFVIFKDLICVNKYLYYVLISDTFKNQANNIIGGTAIPTLSQANLSELLIPVPPLSEQQRIVSILDEAFVAIDKAKTNAEKNLENVSELWEGYLEGVFERKGEGWEEMTLDEVCEISSRLIDPKKNEFQGLIHIGAGNIESKNGKLIDLKTAKEEHLISGKFLFDETMVLYSKIRPYLMKVVNCNFKGLCSADIYPLVPLNEKMIKGYLYYLLLTKSFTEYAIQGSQRAGMPKVNREHLFAYKFYLPNMAIQISTVAKLNELYNEAKKLKMVYQKKILALDELKKSILQRAFVGELTTI